jgi:hypothetical protein
MADAALCVVSLKKEIQSLLLTPFPPFLLPSALFLPGWPLAGVGSKGTGSRALGPRRTVCDGANRQRSGKRQARTPPTPQRSWWWRRTRRQTRGHIRRTRRHRTRCASRRCRWRPSRAACSRGSPWSSGRQVRGGALQWGTATAFSECVLALRDFCHAGWVCGAAEASFGLPACCHTSPCRQTRASRDFTAALPRGSPAVWIARAAAALPALMQLLPARMQALERRTRRFRSWRCCTTTSLGSARC